MPFGNFGVFVAPEPFVRDVGMHGRAQRAKGTRWERVGHDSGVGLIVACVCGCVVGKGEGEEGNRSRRQSKKRVARYCVNRQ